MPTPMTKSHRSQLLVAALVAGIAGDLLLRGGQWRAGFAVWIAGLALSMLLICGRANRERLLMLAGVTCAAFGLAFRDAELLYAIDMLSVLCMGALLIWQGTGHTLADLTLVRTARAGMIAALNTVAGAPGLLARNETDTDTGSTGTARSTIRALTIGAALAAVPLFLVTGLLSASDIVFGRLMDEVFSTVVTDGLSHLFITVLLAWITAGWFRASTGHALGHSVPDPRAPGLPFITVSVVLYALVALLLAFVLTQARVLFGGAEFLRTTANLSVANYAREGFFQLIAASGVVLATLVMAEWLLAADDVHARRQYRTVSVALLALVALLLVSSATRIVLYMNEFGLSVDRAFASAAIVWVFGVLVAFALTTQRGRPMHLMRAAIVVTVGWVSLVNVINPEALVVRVNVARAESGASFDAKYHARLSADALPLLLERANRLQLADCAALHAELRVWWTTRFADPEEGGSDWRSSNLPLIGARRWFAAERSAPTSCMTSGVVDTPR
jgi:hypothetical protein